MCPSLAVFRLDLHGIREVENEVFDIVRGWTGRSEWGCYPTIPALAIAQLATRPGVDAVGVSRWVWNGRERVRPDA